jgi:hypothetical protein
MTSASLERAIGLGVDFFGPLSPLRARSVVASDRVCLKSPPSPMSWTTMAVCPYNPSIVDQAKEQS